MPDVQIALQVLFGLAAGMLLGPLLARFAEAQAAVLDAREAAGLGGSEVADSLRRVTASESAPGAGWQTAHQVAVALCFAGGSWLGGPGIPGVFLALACMLVAYGGLLDLRAFWLPDSVTRPLLWLSLGGAALGIALVPAADAVLGAAAAWMIFALLQMAARICLGQPALGGGDVKLMAACGALCGLSGLPRFLVLVAVATALLGVVWRFARSNRPDWMPLGAAIALAGLSAIVLAALGH